MAVSTESLSALMQQGFGTSNIPNRFLGRNSNEARDPDLKRTNPNFADDRRKLDDVTTRPPDVDPSLEGDELIPLAVRKRQAAIKDPVLAQQPSVRPLYTGSRDMEPVDPSNKVFKSPVFLVDPKFTENMDAEEMTFFTSNDHGGHNKPIVQSQYPIVHKEIMNFFHVGPDCTCKGMNNEIIFTQP